MDDLEDDASDIPLQFGLSANTSADNIEAGEKPHTNRQHISNTASLSYALQAMRECSSASKMNIRSAYPLAD